MFEEMSVGEILKDLRSIKVPKTVRGFIDDARSRFESDGTLDIGTQRRLRQICNQYSRQMRELHAARARARRTLGLKAMGISREEADRRVEMRKKAIEERRTDVGF